MVKELKDEDPKPTLVGDGLRRSCDVRRTKQHYVHVTIAMVMTHVSDVHIVVIKPRATIGIRKFH